MTRDLEFQCCALITSLLLISAGEHTHIHYFLIHLLILPLYLSLSLYVSNTHSLMHSFLPSLSLSHIYYSFFFTPPQKKNGGYVVGGRANTNFSVSIFFVHPIQPNGNIYYYLSFVKCLSIKNDLFMYLYRVSTLVCPSVFRVYIKLCHQNNHFFLKLKC